MSWKSLFQKIQNKNFGHVMYLIFLILSQFCFGFGRDIFTNEKETRRLAKYSEFEMTLVLASQFSSTLCTGALLSPTVGISAAHCKPYAISSLRSGVAFRDGKGFDGKITKTIEIGSVQNFDYWIFEIAWNAGEMPKTMRLTPKIQRFVSEIVVGANDKADRIFTLGFPVDMSKGRLIHCWGYGKEWEGTTLLNNISLINGSSGGFIARESDGMLVSIVSGGPNPFGKPGWDKNDWNDPNHWNVGPSLYQIYEKSEVLRNIFPEGNNKFIPSFATFSFPPFFKN